MDVGLQSSANLGNILAYIKLYWVIFVKELHRKVINYLIFKQNYWT